MYFDTSRDKSMPHLHLETLAGAAAGVASSAPRAGVNGSRPAMARRPRQVVSQAAIPQKLEGILLLDDDFGILGHDEGAEAILKDARLFREGSLNPTIPSQVADALRATAGAGPQFRDTRVEIGKTVYRCCIHIAQLHTQPGNRMTVVHLSRDFNIDEVLVQISAEYRLTVREQQALRGVLLGLSSKEVAQQMEISPNTVKAFLRLIMGKMGVSSRAAIVAKLLDPNGHL